MMNGRPLAWFAAGYVGCFWLFLLTRIAMMWSRDVWVLTISPRRRVFNALGVATLFGLLVVWSGLFVYLAVAPSEHTLLRPWWGMENRLGSIIVIGGVLLAVAGQGLLWAAILTMGRSWRIGNDDVEPGVLVEHGVFRWSRNPIFLGLDGIAVASVLVQPSALFLGIAMVVLVVVHRQILSEERHLASTYGASYEEYRDRVPRYL